MSRAIYINIRSTFDSERVTEAPPFQPSGSLVLELPTEQVMWQTLDDIVDGDTDGEQSDEDTLAGTIE